MDLELQLNLLTVLLLGVKKPEQIPDWSDLSSLILTWVGSTEDILVFKPSKVLLWVNEWIYEGI